MYKSEKLNKLRREIIKAFAKGKSKKAKSLRKKLLEKASQQDG